ncbi:MAG: Arc family DNA-binding protein [Clostridia bacterium]|nr:Arc family DNA-binding protein [Clostridia bacterium]
MTIKVQIGLRVSEEMREKLIKQAEIENRSVNNLLETIIDKYLKEIENESK